LERRFFFSFFGKSKASRFEQQEQDKAWSLFVACTTKSNALEVRNKSDKWVLEINRK
jgi:hypothetical protein